MPACCVNIKRPWSQRYHVSQHSCPEMPKACGSIPPPLGCRRLPGTSLLTGISSRPECQLKRRCGERAAHRTNWIWTGVASLASFRPVGNLAALAWCKAPPLRSAQPQLDSQRCWQFHPCRPREWPLDLGQGVARVLTKKWHENKSVESLLAKGCITSLQVCL